MKASQMKNDVQNTKADQTAVELARVLRDRLNGRGSAGYDQFRAAHLTRKGEQIADTAEAHMDDDELERIARRAVAAGY